MLPTKLNPLGVDPYDGIMEFEKVGNLWSREQEILVDTSNNLYIPSGINDIGDIEWKISIHGTYTLSADITLYEDDDIISPKITMYINYKGGTRTVASVNITNTDNSPHRYSVSCTSDVKKEIKSIQFLLFNGSSYSVHHVKAENIMLSLHGETEYSPYIPNIYRCYGRSTQNQGRNLIALPDYELVYNSTDGLATATWNITNNKIKLISDYSQVSGKYECILKLTNGYMPQFMGSTARKEYFLPPGTYTASFHNKVGGNTAGWGGPSIRFTTPTNKMYQLTWAAGNYTFTTAEPIAYAHVHAYNYVVDCEFELQIEEGPIATSWKPYEEISIDNPIPITSNYPKGRYKTNLPGITIKLDDDLRGLYNNTDNTYCQDYIEVDMSTKEKSITRNVKYQKLSENQDIQYYQYYETNKSHLILAHDVNNPWGMSGVNVAFLCNCMIDKKDQAGAPYTGRVSQRAADTFIGMYVGENDLESFDTTGVLKLLEDNNVIAAYPLSNPTTTLL